MERDGLGKTKAKRAAAPLYFAAAGRARGGASGRAADALLL